MAGTLVAAIVAAYAGSLDGDFLWDDDLHITANPTIIGPLGLKQIWTTARANYFPLVLTNFWLQHALWGLEPFGYRLVTLSFHILSSLLLWQVLRALRVRAAWLGAALWALHPVQVESVAWICELKNTQSAAFFLAAIWAYVRWFSARAATGLPVNAAGRPQLGNEVTDSAAASGASYSLAVLFGALAILSKPSTVMLPVALLLCAWWIRGVFRARDIVHVLPFFALSGIAAGWTIWEQKFHSGATGAEWSQTFPERIVIAGRAIWFYLGKLVWPEPLIFIYPRWEANRVNALVLAAPLAAAVVLLCLWRLRHRGSGAGFFAAGYFVALLFPVLGFFSVYFFRYSFVGDHFQYLASMGPLALAGAAISRVGRRAHALICVCMLAALALATNRQSQVYRSNESLWRDTVALNPAAVMARLNLADTLARAGRHEEAIATFRHAISIRPDDPHGHNDLGNLLVLTGRASEALPHFERALALKPDMTDAMSNLGNALRALGRSAEAIAQYRRALELKPQHPGALNNLGAELAQMGRAAEAIPLFEHALVLKPADPAFHDNLAGALREVGRLDQAIAHHGEAVRFQPEFAEAHANLGRTLFVMGKTDEALRAFERALQLKPTLVAARSHYASALTTMGRTAEAFAQLQQAVENSPGSAEAQHNLGVALAQLGRTAEAVACFERALQLVPEFAPAHANLGTALLALQRWSEAVRHLEAATTAMPNSAALQAQLAVALVNGDRLTDAIPHFEKALRLDPNASETHDNFAQLLNVLGRKRAALEHWEEAARLRRDQSR